MKYTIIVNDITPSNIEKQEFEYYPAIDIEDFVWLNRDILESLKPTDLWEIMARLYVERLIENHWTEVDNFDLNNY